MRRNECLAFEKALFVNVGDVIGDERAKCENLVASACDWLSKPLGIEMS